MATATFLTVEQRAELLDQLIETTNVRLQAARNAARAFTKWAANPSDPGLAEDVNSADTAYDVTTGKWYELYDQLDQALNFAPDAD